jgi:ATP-dependent Lon protease
MAITLETEIQTLYTIALRGLVIFPCGTASFEIGRKKSVNAFKAAFKEGQDIFLVPQQDPSIPDPRPADLMNTGVIAKIDHFVPLNDGGMQIIVKGISRAERINTSVTSDYIICGVRAQTMRKVSITREKIASKELYEVFSEYLNFISKPSEEIIEEANHIADASQLADFLASNFVISFDERKTLIINTLTAPLRKALAKL